MSETYRVTEERLGATAIRAMRDMDGADLHWKREFKGREVATRREFAPAGWRARIRWMREKVLFGRSL